MANTQALKGTAASYFAWALNMCLGAEAAGLFVDIVPEDGRLRDFTPEEEDTLGQSFERMAQNRFKDKCGTYSRIQCSEQTTPELFYFAVADALRIVDQAILTRRQKEERDQPLRVATMPELDLKDGTAGPETPAAAGVNQPITGSYMSSPQRTIRGLAQQQGGAIPTIVTPPSAAEAAKKEAPSLAYIVPHIFIVQDVDRAPPRTLECIAEMLAIRALSAPPGMTVGVLPDMLQLPPLFVVVATSSRIPRPSSTTNFATDPSEGRLPDRLMNGFFMRIPIILRKTSPPPSTGPPRLSRERLKSLIEEVPNVQVHSALSRYVRDCISAIRSHKLVASGLTPRASDAMFKAIRTHAALRGSQFVTPDDITQCLIEVFAHRIIIVPSDLLSEKLTEENAVHIARMVVADAVSSIPAVQ